MRPHLALAAVALASLPALADPARDPFAAYEQPAIAAGAGPLQRYALEALRLRGVVTATASPRALIESPDGATHVARVGDPIGTGSGRIAAIREGAIAVVENYRDAIGGVYRRKVELRLPTLQAGARATQPPAATDR